jgi:hypothetical protein
LQHVFSITANDSVIACEAAKEVLPPRAAERVPSDRPDADLSVCRRPGSAAGCRRSKRVRAGSEVVIAEAVALRDRAQICADRRPDVADD